ncbi:uncharacterized protein UTRI_02918 [Ustilago trichophora]|uniref:Uncharacterized protein n=1 Tax=Ustilago trichophora TaxID=86804 RepID=A0A5C3ESI3_9BASI|nr:uncharacterized protein UTRI_02918 [Ustilago trichophora]
MLRAAEHLTWSATLHKFKCCTHNLITNNGNHDDIQWQQVSGAHLRCKVVATQPSVKAWTLQSSQSHCASFPLAEPPPFSSIDRQLRLIVESGSVDDDSIERQSGEVGSQSGLLGLTQSTPQARAPVVLVGWDMLYFQNFARLDVDLVRIIKTYSHTSRAAEAVLAYHQKMQILLCYMDEYDASKSHRIQLTFLKEEDKSGFLGLIEPDVRVRSADGEAKPSEVVNNVQKEEKHGPADASGSGEIKPGGTVVGLDETQLERHSQDIFSKLMQLAEAKVRQELSQTSACCNGAQSSGDHSFCDAPRHSCSLNCAHSSQHEPSGEQGTKDSLRCSLDSLASVCAEQMETPETDLKEDEMNSELQDGEYEEYEEGLYGWPHPSAVECIVDDVCRLCLTDPNLEWMIARSVDEHLRSTSAPDHVDYR